MHKIGRPVLVGTTTIEKSELLAALLSEYGIPYQLLNAKPENVESESLIVALAGCQKAVTIATNMAGRGTDIVLGGNPKLLAQSLLKKYFNNQTETLQPDELNCFEGFEMLKENYETQAKFKGLIEKPVVDLEASQSLEEQKFLELYNRLLKLKEVNSDQESSLIKNLGGLHVIGTERHESRRIDNQLRGRAGRQGDPGSSRFFLSLEDKLLRIFGGDQILGLMQNIGFQDDTPIESSLLNKSLESAQKKVEAYYFDTRKQLFEYDEALNVQRNCVYQERKRILQQDNLRSWVLDYADRSLYDLFVCLEQGNDGQVTSDLQMKLQNLLGLPFKLTPIQGTTEEPDSNLSLEFFQQQVQITYDLKELEMESIEKGLLRELEKSFILQHIDYSWKEHLQKIAFLRDSIRWRAYGQKNPLTEYKKEAFNYYTIMLAEIRHRVVYFVFSSKIILQ